MSSYLKRGVELRGKLTHYGCLTSEERDITMRLPPQGEVTGKSCTRCGQTFTAPAAETKAQ